MPELPDVTIYVEALQARVAGRVLRSLQIASPFLLRTVEPPVESVLGKRVLEVRRLGKRVVLALEEELFLAFHLMIAGRFRWLPPGAKRPGKIALALLGFESGTLVLTEAGSKKRAALHILRGEAALARLDAGGLEILEADAAAFNAALRAESHTLKRALTDPRLFSGIGNAYSDEILHAARLSPVALTSRISAAEVQRLYVASRTTLTMWIDNLRRRFGARFPGPGEITAFRPGFAVHGRFGQPCPVCGTAVQRIRYAENETNYCPTCQTGGRVLADRSLSRLLREDWPRTVEELEEATKRK
ncbi:MAG TPA: DNA-formamidopyrimidine glycosylase family protein [Phycisphaerae bacterium]|jgi:formamidopyrimidine-DNA glycosylase|nr:DNA-formamidopyrimidine glycosylase family protein [Phycisphaerae bacterium]